MNKQDSKNLAELARLADRNSPGVPPSIQRVIVWGAIGTFVFGYLLVNVFELFGLVS